MALPPSRNSPALPRGAYGLAATYYGDDFTGSTDVMEACVRSGLEAVLFLEPPTPQQVEALGAVDVIGVAGLSRSWSPEEMDRELPGIFTGLKALGAPLFHYKICSTFDSSPRVGSIGRAMEIARQVFGPHPIPLIVGAPILKRYTAFGTLYATADGVTYRIDRHPTMAHHPVTPMSEADLRVHLSDQTTLPGVLIDILALSQPRAFVDDLVDSELSADPGYVLFDVLDSASLGETGRQLLRLVSRRWAEQQATTVAVGSSGVEYALAEQGAGAGVAAGELPTLSPAPTLVVVGSRSPVTAAQTAYAIENGFVEVAIDPAEFIADPERRADYRAELVERIGALVAQGVNTVVTTPPTRADVPIEGNALGRELSFIVSEVCKRGLPGRLVVAGGDTSGHVARGIGVMNLRVATLLAPGSPLCRAGLVDTPGQTLELCLKGGQVGPRDYFVRLAGASVVHTTTTPPHERARK